MNRIKLTAILLAAFLACSVFAGCRNKPQEPQNTPGLPEGAVTKPVTDEELDELIEQGVIEDPNAPKKDVEPAPYEKGVVENNVYRNEAADLTLRIPIGWNAKSDYDLSRLMGVTYDFEDPSVSLDKISQLADIYDMVATDITEDYSIMVLMQDLNQHGIGGTKASEYLETMKSQFTAENATFEAGDITEVSYSGNTYSMLNVTATPNEGTEVTQFFYVREANGRMITVMLTFPSADPINPDTIFA